jgi:hypothetical protein
MARKALPIMTVSYQLDLQVEGNDVCMLEGKTA